MANTFKPGDTVRLTSGGALMSVDRYNEDGSVTCTWLDGKKLHREHFTEATLKKAEPIKPAIASGRRIYRG